jgi:signal transduction histidine kinase
MATGLPRLMITAERLTIPIVAPVIALLIVGAVSWVIRTRNRARAQLSQRLLAAQETQRRGIARQLHEDVGQVLTAVRLNLQRLETAATESRAPILADTVGLVDQAMESIRDLSITLRPAVLDDLGLGPAMRWLVQRSAERAGFEATFEERLGDNSVHDGQGTALFHVAREALTNIARHARAQHVWVELRRMDHQLALTVRDDGLGFSVPAARRRAAGGESLGLLDMEETVTRAGGKVVISSAPGEGTTVLAFFPVTTS